MVSAEEQLKSMKTIIFQCGSDNNWYQVIYFERDLCGFWSTFHRVCLIRVICCRNVQLPKWKYLSNVGPKYLSTRLIPAKYKLTNTINTYKTQIPLRNQMWSQRAKVKGLSFSNPHAALVTAWMKKHAFCLPACETTNTLIVNWSLQHIIISNLAKPIFILCDKNLNLFQTK